MTDELRKATWSGLDGRAVVRERRRKGEKLASEPELADESNRDPAAPESEKPGGD